jgi:hypothetical protein
MKLVIVVTIGIFRSWGTGMVERRKRLALSLSPELHSAIERIAVAQDKKMVTVVSDFLNEFQPYFEDIATSLELAKQGKNPFLILQKMMGNALTEVGSVMSDAAATAQNNQVTK